MREALFLKRNKNKWEKLESFIKGKQSVGSDELSELFIELTDDLSYARTFYPKSNTTKFLNNLSFQAHSKLYKNKKEKSSRLFTFWKYELPLLIKRHHATLLLSFAVFMIAVFVGAISAANDDAFVRLILGDGYVNKTIQNIENGEPMAIYKSSGQMDMFLYITFNNIRVSFFAFIYGIFLSFGTGYILFSNGVMLGSFQYFFYEKGLLLPSVLSVWVHGTLEISAIVIAGCAGFVIGNSILFPKTYSRIHSLRKGAKDGLKIVIGLVPIFLVAGFLEAFVTRHSPDLHPSISAGIIIISLAFIIWYFVIYPYSLTKKQHIELKLPENQPA
jgi:uncharacterized membrane protein SpoIIM required for sporulation